MICTKCNNTGVILCHATGARQDCTCVWTAQETETEGARLEGVQLDDCDRMLLAVREDAQRLRTPSGGSYEFCLLAAARASVAQTLLMERMAWAISSIAQAVTRKDGAA